VIEVVKVGHAFSDWRLQRSWLRIGIHGKPEIE